MAESRGRSRKRGRDDILGLLQRVLQEPVSRREAVAGLDKLGVRKTQAYAYLRRPEVKPRGDGKLVLILPDQPDPRDLLDAAQDLGGTSAASRRRGAMRFTRLARAKRVRPDTHLMRAAESSFEMGPAGVRSELLRAARYLARILKPDEASTTLFMEAWRRRARSALEHPAVRSEADAQEDAAVVCEAARFLSLSRSDGSLRLMLDFLERAPVPLAAAAAPGLGDVLHDWYWKDHHRAIVVKLRVLQQRSTAGTLRSDVAKAILERLPQFLPGAGSLPI